MMVIHKLKISVAILLTFWMFQCNAQFQTGSVDVTLQIPSIALIDIEPSGNNSISFEVDPTLESGMEPRIQDASSQTLWINYSSALPITQSSRSIAAEITSGSLPEGINLSVEVSAYSGIGLGSLGQSQGTVQLDNVPRTIIYGIGNSFTGDGVNNGHALSFFLDVDDFSKVRAVGVMQLTILYTISDN